MGSGVRTPAVAGSFYPEEKNELVVVLKNFFAKTKNIIQERKIKALLLPHAGYIYSGQTAAWGYRQLPTQLKNQHFVLIGPSHFSYFHGLVCSSANFWQTPLGKVRHFPSWRGRFKTVNGVVDDRPHLLEHSLEVQLPFLQFLFSAFSLSCFLTGGKINYQKTAQYFLNLYSSSIFIISSDLSHYLPEKQAREKDKKTIEAILKLDGHYFKISENVACGVEGILILLEMVKKVAWRRKLIYYDTSSTATSDTTSVVGYGTIVFFI